MRKQANSDYFAARAADEYQKSFAATDPRVAAIHAEMAIRYVEATMWLIDGTPTEFDSSASQLRRLSAEARPSAP